MHSYTIYYKLLGDRATYIGAGSGRTEAEALETFKRDHRGQAFQIRKIIINE